MHKKQYNNSYCTLKEDSTNFTYRKIYTALLLAHIHTIMLVYITCKNMAVLCHFMPLFLRTPIHLYFIPLTLLSIASLAS